MALLVHAPVDLSPLAATADLQATFAEHEELKAILRAGRSQFEIQTIYEVHSGNKAFLFM